MASLLDKKDHIGPRFTTKLSVPAVSDTRRPGDGFYKYVNEKWLNTHHIPGWQGEFSVSDEMTNETDKELLEILHNLPDLNKINLNPKTSKQHLQLLGYIWKNTNPEKEEQYLQVCVHELMEAKSTEDIARFFGWMVRSSIPTIIGIGAREEIVSPYLVRATLSPGTLILPLKYYLEPELKKTEVWKAYEEFISVCSIELGLPLLHKAIESEQNIAPILYSSFQHIAQSKRGSSLKSWMPDFEWQNFMSGLDIDAAWERRIWVIDSTEKFKKILNWICTVKEEYIYSILILHLVKAAAPYLRKPIKDAYNNLFKKALQGVNQTPPMEKFMLHDVKDILPDALCNVYSVRHRSPGALKHVKELVNSLRESAVETMESTDLLSKKTKSRVKEKIHRMWFELGKGGESPLPNVSYTPDSLLHTIFSIHSERAKMIPSMTGKPADKIHSSYPCFITNASYFEESNHIVIPWGILQWPFYSEKAPLGWNHGGIGATICHEITHAFDLEGSLYSPRATFRELWTRKDHKVFKTQTRKVARFFKKFKHYGKPLDGDKTLSENWADLGGLKISLNSLNKLLEKATDKEKKEAHRNFFISYAVSWRNLIKKKALLYSIMTSVHSPGEDRVDRNVVQFQEWIDAFDIKESDPLYLKPSERLKFF